MAKYKRVLLKLSGEALKSGSDLFDFSLVDSMAGIIREMHETGTQIGIVIGAGNIWRGRGAIHKRGKGVGAAHDPQPRQARLHHLRIPCKEG